MRLLLSVASLCAVCAVARDLETEARYLEEGGNYVEAGEYGYEYGPVSYTHLTLPTILLV